MHYRFLYLTSMSYYLSLLPERRLILELLCRTTAKREVELRQCFRRDSKTRTCIITHYPNTDVERRLASDNGDTVQMSSGEDLPYLPKVSGEDSLMVGSDYTHRDSSMEYEFPRLQKERAEKGEISHSQYRKFSTIMPKIFYGL